MSSTCAVRLHHHVVGRAPASSSSSSSRQTTKIFPCAKVTARVVVVCTSGGGSGGGVRGAVRLRRSEHRAHIAVERGTTTWANRGAVVCTATATAGAAPGLNSGENDGGDPTVGLSEWWTTFTRAPWDEGPKPWREFWAVKVAAAVVEVDVAKESVSAKEVEGIGLNAPTDSAEALARVKCNLIFYRQNYILALYLSAVLAHLTNPLAAVALLAGGGAAACVSDTLLGELSMLSDGKLVWNATRVAGLDRQQTRTGLATLAAVAFFCSVRWSAGSLLLSLASGMTMVLVHAMLRPIDLKSTLSNLWKDVTNVQNREEAEAIVKKGIKGIQSWWKNRRPSDSPPVVVSVKEDPAAYTGGGFGGAAAQQARQAAAAARANARGRSKGGTGGGDDNVVDTTGTVKPDMKGELPSGRKMK